MHMSQQIITESNFWKKQLQNTKHTHWISLIYIFFLLLFLIMYINEQIQK